MRADPEEADVRSPEGFIETTPPCSYLPRDFKKI